MTAHARAAQPPKHLQDPGKALWRGVLRTFDISDAHDLARLQAAAEAADRIAEARAAVERDGPYTSGRFGLKAHPALAVERDSRTAMLRAIREIGVDVVDPQATRPPSRWRG